jgi:hypothetical protein
MDTQKITLGVPKRVLRQIRILAKQRNTSVSALVMGVLEDLVSAQDAYARARRRHRALLRRRLNLATGGRVSWSREQMHER